MKIISGSKSGNFSLYRRMTKNEILGAILKIFKVTYIIWEVKVGMYFLGGVGGTIEKYPRAKQSLDSNTNSL